MRITGITYVPRKAHTMKTSFAVIFILIVILLLTTASISAYYGWHIVHPLKTDLQPFSSNIAPEYKNVSFSSDSSGIQLSGWFFEKKGSRKTVILAHDYGKNRLQFGEETLEIIKGFLNKDYSVLTFDFRNSGKSDGTSTTMGYLEKDDLLGAIKYVKSTQGSGYIVLMGFSMGAATSILAAAESSDVSAVVADTPYSNFADYLSGGLITSRLPSLLFDRTILLSVRLFAGISPNKADPRNFIGNAAPKPILFIHSKNDSAVPFSDSVELYTKYSKIDGVTAELWETESTGHLKSFTEQPQLYMDKVLNFLDDNYTKSN